MIPGRKLNLRGKEYVVNPLSWREDADTAAARASGDDEQILDVILLGFRNHPEVTRETLMDILDKSNTPLVLRALLWLPEVDPQSPKA